MTITGKTTAAEIKAIQERDVLSNGDIIGKVIAMDHIETSDILSYCFMVRDRSDLRMRRIFGEVKK